MSFQSESDTERSQQQQQQRQKTTTIASLHHDGHVTECQRDARVPSSSSSSSSSNQHQANPGISSDDREDHQVPSSSSSSVTPPPSSSSSSSSSSLSSLSSPPSSSLHAGGAQLPHKQGGGCGGGGGQSIIRCSICSKTFNNSSALAKHKLIHSDERKYACQRCNKSFKRQDHLNGHMMTHAEQKPFRCQFDQCEKSYCDNRSLRRHYENHHQHQLLPQQQQQKNASATSNLPESAILTPGLTPRSAGPLSAEGTIFNFENIDLRRFHLASTDGGCVEGVTSVPPSPSTFNQLQMSPVSPAVGQQKPQDVNSSIFPFNEPKPVVCTVCAKRFKNTPALNGHMRLHGGYTKKPPANEKEKQVPPGGGCAPSSADIRQARPASKQLENYSPPSRHDDSSTLSSPLVHPDPSTSADNLSNFSPGGRSVLERASSPDPVRQGADSLSQTVGRWLREGREVSALLQKSEDSPGRRVSSDASDRVSIKRENSEDVQKEVLLGRGLRADSLTSSLASFTRERDLVRSLVRANATMGNDGRENSRPLNGISGDGFVGPQGRTSLESNLLQNDAALPMNIWMSPERDNSTVPGHEITLKHLEKSHSDLPLQVLGLTTGDEKLSGESQGMVLDEDESMDDDQVIELLYNLETGESAAASQGLSGVAFLSQKPDLSFCSDLVVREVEPMTLRKQPGASLPSNDVDFLNLHTDAIIIPPESIFQPSQAKVSMSLTPPMNQGHPVEGSPHGKNSSFISKASDNVGNLMSLTIQAVPLDQFSGNVLLQEGPAEEPATPSFAFQQKCSLRGDQVDDQESVFSFQNAHLSQVSFSVLDSNVIPQLFVATSQHQVEMENIKLLPCQSSSKQNNIFAFANPHTSSGQRHFVGSQEIKARLLSSQISDGLLVTYPNSTSGEPQNLTDSQLMELRLKILNDDKREANEVIDACLNKLKAQDDMRRNMFLRSALSSSLLDGGDSSLILMDDQAANTSGFQAVQHQKELITRAYLVPVSGAAILPTQRTVELQGQHFASGSKPEQTIILLSNQDLLNLQANSNLLEVKVVNSQDNQQAFVTHPLSSKSCFDQAFSFHHEEQRSSSSLTFMMDHHILPGQRTKRKMKPQPLNIPFSANNFHSHGGCAGGIKRPSSPQKSVPSPRRLKSSHSPLATPQPLRVIPEGSARFSELAPPQSAPPHKKDFDVSLYSFDVRNDLNVQKFLSGSDEDSRP